MIKYFIYFIILTHLCIGFSMKKYSERMSKFFSAISEFYTVDNKEKK